MTLGTRFVFPRLFAPLIPLIFFVPSFVFAQTYTISATAGLNGTISPSGDVSVSQGGSQAFMMLPGTGYHVDSVLVDDGLVDSTASYTFTNVTANHTIRAVFVIDTFTITASTGANGAIVPPGVTIVPYGGGQSYIITPNTGYHVADVLVNGSSVGAVTSYDFADVRGDSTISVTFAIDQFTIAGSAGLNGTISPNGSVPVSYGGNQTFTFTPSTGYHVDSLYVDGVSQPVAGSYQFTNVTTNHTIHVTFAIDQFTITASAELNGTISPNGSVPVIFGSNQTFTFTPSTGYHVDSLYVDGVSQLAAGSYQFTNVTANHTIHVTFAIDQFTITASAGANGTISPNGSVPISFGGNQTFTFTPSTGYHVDSLYVDGVSQPAAGSYQFTNVTANHTIHVTFAIDQFTITASAGLNGAISPNGSVPVSFGGNQTFTFTPSTGYHVDSLYVDGVSQPAAGSYQFTNVTTNHTIHVTFAIDQFTIAASAGLNGAISPNGSVPVSYGSNQTFTFTPSTGYHVDSLYVDGVSQPVAGSYQFTNVTTNHTIHVTFAIDQFTITASAGLNGAISPNGSVPISFGGNQTFTFTPSTGYHVDSLYVDGVSQPAAGSYQFTNVTSNHTIHVTFAIDQFTIAASAGLNGAISPNGSVPVSYGSNQTFTFTPSTGYHVDSLYVDGVSQPVAGSYQFTNVTTNHTIHVTFAIDQFTITASAGANGVISPAGVTTVSYGGSQSYTITPNLHYQVADVLVDGVSVGAVTNYTFSSVTAAHTINATFAFITHTITATSGLHGTLVPLGLVPVNDGADMTFTATPETGYSVHFVVDGVLGRPVQVNENKQRAKGAGGSANGPVTTYTFTNVTGNHTIDASFSIDTSIIIASSGLNGTISPNGSVPVIFGSNQTFTFTPSTGYHVDSLYVDGVSQPAAGSYQFTNVTTNHTIHVTFAIDQFTIAASAGLNGTISPNGSVPVSFGGNQTFTFTPSTGYHVDSLYVDGVSQPAAGSYQFTNVTTNHTIHVTFAIDQFTIAASAGANGTISPNGSVPVIFGSNQTFTFTPSTGYHVDSLYVDGVSQPVAGSYQFTNVTTNHTIHVTFAIDQFTIAASAGLNGTISPNGSVPVSFGGNQTFTFTPSTGYHVDSLYVDGVSQPAAGSYQFTNVTTNHTIHVTFAIDQFTIAASAGANGTISPNGSVPISFGGNQTFTFTPSTGYHVDSLYVDGVSQPAAGSYQFTNVTTNHTIHVTFAIDQFTIAASAGANGTISPNGSVPISFGGNQTFTFTPSTGYHVDSLYVDGVSQPAAGSYQFTNVTTNHTIHVTFAIDQFTIAASAGLNGTISPNGSVPVSYGSNQTFTFTPSTGYHVDSLYVDGVSQPVAGSYQFTNVTTNHTIHVTFAIDQFTIAGSAGLNGTISPNGSVPVSYGGNQTFTFTPSTGYHVDSLYVDGVSQPVAGSYQFTNVTTNHTIRVTFAIDQFTIAASAGLNGTISPNGSVPVTYGGSQTFTFPPSTGYHVDSVLVDDAPVDSTLSYTFTNVTANHIIRVAFRINKYTITATAGLNGTISPSGAVNVTYGGSQVFTMIPVTGYHVDSVLVDDARVDSMTSYTFTNVAANHTIRAVFRINEYTITATAGLNGTISPVGEVNVSYGGNQAFTMTPATGYHIDSVLVDDVMVGPAASYTFTFVTSNHTIRAVFRINEYTITSTAGLNGTISPNGVVNVTYGGSQVFTMTPVTGYHVDSVLVDGVRMDSTTSYTFSNVAANHTIRAVFRVNEYAITATAGLNGTISPSGVVNVTYGGNQAFTMTPATGYHIDSVLVDDVMVGSPTSYTFTIVTSNHTIRTVFRINEYTITASAGSNGTITPGGVVNVTYGGSQAFTMTPGTEYHVDSVLVDGARVDSTTSYTFTNVAANHTIRVAFRINEYTITATAGLNGTISPSGVVNVTSGGNQAFTMTPATGYYVDSVLVDGVRVDSTTGYTFTNVTTDHAIRVVFRIIKYMITASAGSNGTISPSGVVDVSYGGSQTFTMTPATGYRIDSVLVDNVLMDSPGSYTFTNVTANHTIRVAFVMTIVEVTVTLNQGWDLISKPVTTSSDSVKQLFPASTFAYAFQFNPGSGLTRAHTMENGIGYWETFPVATAQFITGFPRQQDSISVVQGWNLIGTISHIIDTATVTSVPPGLRGSNWYGYAFGYLPMSLLEAGKGYWVKANTAGKFVFTSLVTTGVQKAIVPGLGLEQTLNSLTITDSRRGLQTLFFGVDETNHIPVDLFSMPPLPPQGAFDARFATTSGGTMVQTHALKPAVNVEFPVTIQSDAYPLTVSWKMHPGSALYEMTDGVGGRLFPTKELRGQGSMTIANSDLTGLSIRLVSDGQLPKEFALQQNYPNPFNPSTTIKYDLPVDARVSLKVFTILGEEVETLVNEEQKAGHRFVEWNARNLASGTYFYRLQAGSFTGVKKLLLVK